MPRLSERIAGVLKAWYHERVLVVLSKAPRERPDLVFVVFVLAVLLVLLYVYAYAKGF
jgi:hypothetical protein